MPKLYVTEYTDGDIWSAKEPPVAEQAFTFGVSTQSDPFNTYTRLIRVHTDAICSVAISQNPTATTNSRRMAINTTEYWAVEGGFRIAAVTNT